jgi:hypothetical protein
MIVGIMIGVQRSHKEIKQFKQLVSRTSRCIVELRFRTDNFPLLVAYRCHK